jgi:hypothetical protein
MSEEKTKWIYLHPGEDGPSERPSNLEEWHYRDRCWVKVYVGNSMWRHGYGFYRYRLEPKREPITADTVLTEEMEVVGGAGISLNSESFVGEKIKDLVGTKICFPSVTFRYIDEPDTEFTYTKPIEWVTPNDEDARHRPEVVVKNYNGVVWQKATLLAVTKNSSKFRTTADWKQLTAWECCRMDAKQREMWK